MLMFDVFETFLNIIIFELLHAKTFASIHKENSQQNQDLMKSTPQSLLICPTVCLLVYLYVCLSPYMSLCVLLYCCVFPCVALCMCICVTCASVSLSISGPVMAFMLRRVVSTRNKQLWPMLLKLLLLLLLFVMLVMRSEQ